MSEELAVYEAGEKGKSPGALIAMALEKQADPTTLSKLMDLQERWEANTAKKLFVQAMTAYKQEAPSVLKKLDKVDFQSAKGRTAYSYANLGQIVQEVTALLGKHGLSATWQTSQQDNNITVTCHITHSSGHRESVTLTAPPDESGNKNKIQAIGSAVTYLQRYTLLAALGLATTDADDDGRGGMEKKTPITPPQEKKAEAKAETTANGDLSVKAIIEKTSSKEGTKGSKKWTLYGILAGGIWYNTFDKKLFEIANANIDKEVEIIYTEGDKGKNLISIRFEGCGNNPLTCDLSTFEGDKPFCGDNVECQFGIANA